MNIILTGFMGTGKSAVGKLLAERLGWEFFDTDDIIQNETGFSIATIFAKKGEAHFRALEAKAVALLGLLDKAVIACGGGVVLNSQNMDELEKNGIVVCLTAAPEVIFERVKNDTGRPLLKTKEPLQKMRDLLSERESCYRRCHVTLDTGKLSIIDVVEKILDDPAVKDKR
jgi:shikimate kinase